MMSRTAKRPTKAEQLRIDGMMRYGCIVSRLRAERGLPVPTQINECHHITRGRKRLGHGYTICLRAWYHRGIVPYPATSKAEARQLFGASLAQGSKLFAADHGYDELELWAIAQKYLGLPAVMKQSKIVPRRAA